MKYAIIGCGRMGSIISGALAKAGAEVWAIDTWPAHVNAINEHGLTVCWNEAEETYTNIHATTNATDAGVCDVAVILVGGNFTKDALESARAVMDENTYVYTLQNGYGHTNAIRDFGIPEDRILYGVVGYGGTITKPGYMKALISPGAVMHFGPFDHKIAPVHEQIAADLAAGGLLVDLNAYVDKEIWFKLGMNSVANAQCGLARCNLGIWSGSQFTRDVRYKTIEEVVKVANALGVDINMEQFLPKLDRTMAQMGEMAHHFPSTAQDMKAKKITEIEFLNGAVFHEGQRLGIPTPYNEMIYILTKAAEAAYDLDF